MSNYVPLTINLGPTPGTTFIPAFQITPSDVSRTQFPDIVPMQPSMPTQYVPPLAPPIAPTIIVQMPERIVIELKMPKRRLRKGLRPAH